jgi:hypothetical protein
LRQYIKSATKGKTELAILLALAQPITYVEKPLFPAILAHSNRCLLSSFFHKHPCLTDRDFKRKNQDLTSGLCSQEKPTSSSYSRMGLSFFQDLPLGMRIDKRIKRTATDIVNKEDEKSLADLINEFS